MRRRDFAAGLLLTAAVRAARAQQPAKQHRIAIVVAAGPIAGISDRGVRVWQAFFAELRRLGDVEGQNLAVEFCNSAICFSVGDGGGGYQEASRLCIVQRSAMCGNRQCLLVLDDRVGQVGTPRIPVNQSAERPPCHVRVADSWYRGRHLWAPVGEPTRRSVNGRGRPRNEGIHRHRSRTCRSLLRTAASRVRASHRTLERDHRARN